LWVVNTIHVVQTYLSIKEKTVYLISIFDKADKDSLTDKELKELLKQIIPIKFGNKS
jgi:hypothetical protein